MMAVVLTTSVSPSGNLVTTKKFPQNLTNLNNLNINLFNTNNDMGMTTNPIINGRGFDERPDDGDNSSYHFNFTNNLHNINKNATETNANEILNLKDLKDTKLISINSNSTSSSSSSSSLFLPSSFSSSPSSTLRNTTPNNNNNNNINTQHITTTSSNIKKPFTENSETSPRWTTHIDFNNDFDLSRSPVTTTTADTTENLNSRHLSILESNKPQLKFIEVDRCVIIPDDIIKSRHCLRKQPPPSKIQRIKRTLSITKKFDKEESGVFTCCNYNNNNYTTTTTLPPREIYPFRPLTMTRVSSITKNHSIETTYDDMDVNNKGTTLQRSCKNFSNDSTTATTQPQNHNNNDSQCACNSNIRKRVKSNNIHRCTFSSSPSSPSSLSFNLNSSEKNGSSTSISESRDQFIINPTPAVKERHSNSMDEQRDLDIRRTWSHIEVRNFKGLFKRNRHISDVQRRNSYAYTNSTRAKQDIVSESEYKVLNHVHDVTTSSDGDDDSSTCASDVDPSSPKKFPVDIFALQADMEKETDVITRSRQMRKFIISEIYSTEQSYLSHMKTLKKTFMDPCIDASTSPPLMNKDDVKIIFAHINELIKLSDTIVETLETSMDPWEDYDSKMGHVFLKFAKGFEVFEKYAENIQKSRQLLAKKVNQSVFYRKFISSQRKKENIKLGLNDYMIMPIQRVTRYSLLLKELKKHTSESHSDYNDLCKALDNMLSLTSECNNNIQSI